MSKRYIVADLEGGGTTIKHSLLSVYFVVLDEDLETVYGELDLRLSPMMGII